MIRSFLSRDGMAGRRRWLADASAGRRFSIAVGLGLLAAAALPPVYAIPLLVPAFVGLVWLVETARTRRGALGIGWGFGFGYFAGGLHWVAAALLVDAARHGWMIPFAIGGLSAVMAAFPAGAAWLAWRPRRDGVGAVLVFAAAWTLFEIARGWALTGFPWNSVGTVWTAFDATMQPAAWIGVHGLSLVTVLAAAMPASLAGPGRAGWAVVASLAVLAAGGTAGAVRLGAVPAPGSDGADQPGILLRLVQPAIPQALKWKSDLRAAHIRTQLAMSRRHVPGPQPTHVIWGETMVPAALADDEPSRPILEALGTAAPPGGLLITGAPRRTPRGVEPLQIWNSLFAIDGSGTVVATYDKAHLVPFGEYVPLRGLLPLDKITAGATDFTPGPGLRTLHLPGLPPVGPLICYEVIFSGRVVNREDRPSWLLNLTNDAWYGRSAGPYQHFATTRLRAVEEGLPVVRVANTGISGVIDAYGRVVGHLELGRTGTLDAPLPQPIEPRTLYARLGSAIALVLVISIGGVGLLWPGRRSKP